MTPNQFLTYVLADEGSYCVSSLADGKAFRSHFCDSINEMTPLAAGLVAQQMDTYFAMASFTADDAGTLRRQGAHASKVKCFWLDIDGGAGKPYADAQGAMDALAAFCQTTGLPTPTMNCSGNGIHAYWVLTESITPAVWKPVATRLKNLCIQHNLQADHGCTADIARVLRIPSTINFGRKRYDNGTLPADFDMGDATMVVHISAAPPMELVDFALLLGADAPTTADPAAALGFTVPSHIQQGVDADTRALMGANNEYKFSKIILLREAGCAQLTNIATNQADVEEPLWRAGLSIAHHCTDRAKAIHKMSDQHPRYSAADTEEKAALTKGPYLCSSFQGLNPSLCAGCPHAGKIKSPIVLGKVIAAAPAGPGLVTATDSGTGENRSYEIPEYPFPYFRGKTGGVYRKSNVDGEDDIMVYEHDFYVFRRLRDPDLGEVLWCRLHLPKDGVRDFSIPLSGVMAKDRFRDVITSQGMAVMGKTVDELMFYVSRRVKELQYMGQAGKVRSQFGWTDDDTFIIGDREITPTEIRYSPPSSAILNMCALTQKRGTLAKWTEIANFYNRPGMEAHAFAFLLGFGSALTPFTQARGGIVNLLGKSGAGKSTVQLMINSIWGRPFEMMLNVDDTQNARIHRFGVLNNLPATIDEVTGMRDDMISQLAYAITQGRGKNRMESQSNAERINNTSWKLFAITSSNASLYDKLAALKSLPEGEMMRIIELTLHKAPDVSKEFTDKFFAPIHDNFGVAGEVFAQYIVANRAGLPAHIAQVQRAMDKATGFGQRERFWSIMASLAITGGEIANDLGLIHFDLNRIASWLATQLQCTARVLPGAALAGDHLAEFISENMHNTLIVNNSHTFGLPQTPIRMPRNELVLRYEPDTKVLYISTKRLREWCARNQVSFASLQAGAELIKLQISQGKKRMSAGTGVNAPASNVVIVRDPEGVLLSDDILQAPTPAA